MHILTKYTTKRRINTLASTLFETNEYYITLSLSKYHVVRLKPIYMDVFTRYLFKNISNNSSKEECLVCYDSKHVKYKIPCCDKQYVCIKCFEKMYNFDQFKCLYCRKNLYKDDIIEITRQISIHYLFKINNICHYFYNCGYAKDIHNIQKVDNDHFNVKIDNINYSIVNYNNGEIYIGISSNYLVKLSDNQRSIIRRSFYKN